jgi:shikimate dehydrogenase
VTYLASDELEGRGPGTKGIDLAADYIAAQFEKMGLKTDLFDGGPFQKFSFNVATEMGPPEQNRLSTKGLMGLNVTVPYKEVVMKHLDEVYPVAKFIGAVNVIKISNGKKIGFNTDSDAFYETLTHWLPKGKTYQAIILGTGGSSKAVQKALKKKNMDFKLVSREKKKGDFTYEDLKKNPKILTDTKLLINTTPLGMHPNNDDYPPIEFAQITKEHYVYDLIYNPARTVFLQKAEMHGGTIKNGLEMLHVQAEKSWEIWNS